MSKISSRRSTDTTGAEEIGFEITPVDQVGPQQGSACCGVQATSTDDGLVCSNCLGPYTEKVHYR